MHVSPPRNTHLPIEFSSFQTNARIRSRHNSVEIRPPLPEIGPAHYSELDEPEPPDYVAPGLPQFEKLIEQQSRKLKNIEICYTVPYKNQKLRQLPTPVKIAITKDPDVVIENCSDLDCMSSAYESASQSEVYERPMPKPRSANLSHTFIQLVSLTL